MKLVWSRRAAADLRELRAYIGQDAPAAAKATAVKIIEKPWPAVRDQLNRLLGGWSAYFCYGSRADAYKAVDHHVCDRVRRFLKRRHKVPDRGTRRFPSDMIFGELGVLPLDYRRAPHNEDRRKAGCGKPARPV